MFKIISSEEHAKLTKDVDYWKALALKEEKRKYYLGTVKYILLRGGLTRTVIKR